MRDGHDDLVIVTDWEKPDENDFYLSDDWRSSDQKRAKELHREGNLYIAYEVSAMRYVLYKQMDAKQVFVDGDGETIMDCEIVCIGNKHRSRWKVDY